MKDLGLKDNPFDPRRLKGGAKRYLQQLDRAPLRVDLCSALEHLYFDKFPIAAKHQREWERRLGKLGYAPGETRPNVSAIAIIRGSIGSGKTTLAASFLRYLRRCGAPDDAKWEDVSQSFPDHDITRPLPPDEEIGKVCGSLRKELEQRGEDLWTYALVENVTEDSLGGIVDIFQNAGNCIRVFVITTDDLPLLRNEDALRSYPVTFEDFPLEPLDEEIAVDYARFRVDHFRHEDYRQTPLCDPMFPLLDSAVRKWSMPDANAPGNVRNPLVVRVLNTMLSKKIDQLSDRFEADDVRNVLPPENVPLTLLQEILRDL